MEQIHDVWPNTYSEVLTATFNARQIGQKCRGNPVIAALRTVMTAFAVRMPNELDGLSNIGVSSITPALGMPWLVLRCRSLHADGGRNQRIEPDFAFGPGLSGCPGSLKTGSQGSEQTFCVHSGKTRLEIMDCVPQREEKSLFKIPGVKPGNWRGEILGGSTVNFGQAVQSGPTRQSVEFTYVIMPTTFTMPDVCFTWPGVLMIMTPTPMKAEFLFKVESLPSLHLLLKVTRGQFSDVLRMLDAKRLKDIHFTVED